MSPAPEAGRHEEAAAAGGGMSPTPEAGRHEEAAAAGGDMSPAPEAGGGGAPAGGSGGATSVAGKAGAPGGTAGEGGTPGGGAAAERRRCPKTEENAAGGLELITLSLECGAADGDVHFSSLTRDGRYVAFDSEAGDLVANDLNGMSDGFLFDLEERELELISKKYGGEGPANGYTYQLVPSDDGRYVAFTSYSYELVSPVPPEGTWVYLRDRLSGTTRRFVADYACTYWVDMTGGAEFILAEGFSNCEGGLEEGDHDSALEYDLSSGAVRHLGVSDDGSDNYRPAISRDGRFVLWATRPAGTRGEWTSRLELYDRTLGTSETLPIYAYHFGYTDISDSGDVIAFSSNGQVYRYVVSIDELTLVSKNALGDAGDGASDGVSLSGDGRLMVFRSAATNLDDDDTNDADDIFLFDAADRTLRCLSVAPNGSRADDHSSHPYISGDGTKVSFASKARNLLPLATSGNNQLYVVTLPE